MHINYTITKNDYLRFQKFVGKQLISNKSSLRKRPLKRFIIWISIVIIVAILSEVFSFSLPDLHMPTLIFTSSLLVIFIVFFFYFFLKFQRDAIPVKDGIEVGEKTIELNEKGITTSSKYRNSFCKWNAVDTVSRNDGDVYIFIDKSVGFIVPESAFSSDEERFALWDFVRSHAPSINKSQVE